MSRFAGRNLDRVWFLFLVAHIPITLGLDAQAIYPSWVVAGTPLPAFLKWYIGFSRDPIMGGVFSGDPSWTWMRTFFFVELFFQVPCFIIGAIGLWKNDKRVYPLLAVYGASTATTLVPTLHAVLFDTKTNPPLTSAEVGLLLSSYVPFLLIPLAMAGDMANRIVKLIGPPPSARKNI